MNQEVLPFETILSWFGKFTPQLKNYLRLYQQANSTEVFARFGGDVFGLYRQIGFRLARLQPGKRRAEAVHAMMDDEFRVLDLSSSSCRKGCHSCCYSEKHVTSDEADLLASHISEERSSLKNRFFEQAEKKRRVGKWNQLAVEDKRCPFLDEQGGCTVYSLRPAVCRKHYVSSPAENCRSMKGEVQVELLLVPEIIASAALSLPDQKIGSMAAMIAERLEVKEEQPVIVADGNSPDAAI